MGDNLYIGQVPTDIVFPIPRDSYDEQMQRAIRDYLNKIALSINDPIRISGAVSLLNSRTIG